MAPEKIILTDTHCHLDFADFDQDRELVISRAREAGLERILNPGTDLTTSRAALKLAEQNDEIYAAVGVHPNSALSWNGDTGGELEELASHPKAKAIGEIGLDYYRKGAPIEVQRTVFTAQLSLAAKMGLPVIIHNRDACEDVMGILDGWVDELKKNNSKLVDRPGVLHSFSGNLAMAEWAVERNFFIGLTGPVTYRNADLLRQVVARVPLENVLIETDSPFLTPHPFRGKRNEPAHVRLIAGKIGELRTIEMEVVAQASTRNAGRLFCWREID